MIKRRQAFFLLFLLGQSLMHLRMVVYFKDNSDYGSFCIYFLNVGITNEDPSHLPEAVLRVQSQGFQRLGIESNTEVAKIKTKTTKQHTTK